MDERPITARYRDPLEAVWLTAARAVGFHVARSDQVYAAWDGRGTLTLGTAETLDPDDTLAQMIFHELCHALVQGPERLGELDFGLCNFDDRDRPREHAALRVQAALAGPHGLRRLLAPTTVYRAWYDALPDDPLAGPDDGTLALARQALARAALPPFGPALERALDATRAVVAAALPALDADAGGLPWLGARLGPAAGRHPSGFHLATHAPQRAQRCGACAWWADGACAAARAAVPDDAPACERWEEPLDCRACGACCHRGFDVVDVDPDEPLLAAHPGLATRQGERWVLTRPGGRCVALRGGADEPFACAVYPLRPEGCRDLAPGGENCLVARRRAGLSR